MSNPIIRDVKGASGNAASVLLAAFASDPVNGDTIVVAYGQYHSSAPLAPQDPYGNTYVQIGTTNVASSSNSQSLWMAKNIIGGPNFRVTCRPNGSYFACEAWALTNVDIDPYNNDFHKDSAVHNNFTTSGQSTPAPFPNSIFLGFSSLGASNVNTDQAGWNIVGANGFTAGMLTAAQINDYSANFDCWGAYKISSTVETAQWTDTSGNHSDRLGMVASFAGPRLAFTSLAPSSGSTVGGTTVTLTGVGFTAGTPTVTFDGTPATSVVVLDDAHLTCVTPAHVVGTVDVAVTVLANTVILPASFTYVKPDPVLTPPIVIRGYTTDIDLISLGDVFTNQTVASFSGTGVQVNSTTFLSATHLRINVTLASNATPGTRDLTLTTP